jgi:hypothetical protein
MEVPSSMSRFGSPVEACGSARGSTAAGFHVETIGRIFKSYLLRAHPPARLEAGEAAELLGFHADDMPLLVREKLLTPLGNPANNKKKYFSLLDVEALGRDPERLAAATNAIYARNEEKTQDSCCQALRIRPVHPKWLIRFE